MFSNLMNRFRIGACLSSAKAAMAAGDFSTAVNEVETAIKIDPKQKGLEMAHNVQGVCYMELGDYQKSQTAFQSAISIAPNFLDARRNYGILLFRMKKLDAAADMLLSVLVADPGQPQIREVLARIKQSVTRAIGRVPGLSTSDIVLAKPRETLQRLDAAGIE